MKYEEYYAEIDQKNDDFRRKYLLRPRYHIL